MKTKLIVFTRYPQAGRTKTRLIPALGAEGAADLQRQMTKQIVRTALLLTEDVPLEIEINFAGGSIGEMENWLGQDLCYRPQGSGDLGEKMDRAFSESFHDGYHQVIIIGADCPNISVPILTEAFNKLAEQDLVLGPATDGGYYLIGLSALYPRLFTKLPWGTSKVLPKTLAIAEKLALSLFLLEELSDVDRPEDLKYFGGDPHPE
ncbi:MAG: TIGR04282 family arsenosugar biosynthesis glycosyltransferase [Thermodesulfobacteriota bacterium]